ncbi:unnamed protein product [Lampetra planeri]
MTATYQQRQSKVQVSLWLRAASPATTSPTCHRSSRRRRVAAWNPPPPRPAVETELAGAGVDAGMMADAAQHEPRTGCVFLLLPCGGVYTVEVNECDRLSDVVSRANECHGPLVPSAATLHHQGRRIEHPQICPLSPCCPLSRQPGRQPHQGGGQGSRRGQAESESRRRTHQARRFQAGLLTLVHAAQSSVFPMLGQ